MRRNGLTLGIVAAAATFTVVGTGCQATGADCGAHLIDSHWRWDSVTKTFKADE